MPTRVYPFIDIAVHDQVRPHFLAGDAVVILTVELDVVIWANGTGAVLLGYDSIEAVRGAPSNLGLASRRQIAGTPGFPAIGANRSLLVRVTQRLSSHAVGFLASEITLPGGTHAIMLVAPDFDAEKRSAQEIGARVIHGIGQAGHHAALFGDDGAILASTSDFTVAGPDVDELAELADDVRRAPDRLVKRLVQIGEFGYPVGVARLSESPQHHLMIVVDDPQPLPVSVREGAPAPPVPAPAPARAAAARPLQTVTAPMASHDSDTWHFADRPAPARSGPAPQPGLPEAASEAPAIDPAPAEGSAHDRVPDPTPAPAADDSVADAGEASLPDLPVRVAVMADLAAHFLDGLKMPASGDEEVEAPPAGEDPSGPDEVAPRTFGAPADDALPDRPTETPLPPRSEEPPVALDDDDQEDESVDDDAVFRPDFRSGPVRFVWRTDSAGRFSTVSDELGRSVGETAADLIGKTFREVSAAFGLDPDGEIAGLLERRDTWSGRSVMWPIEGTDLKVPVDLAALPVYARDRSFEGFRGFGVVRLGDAVIDEEAVGLSLTPSRGRAPASLDRPSPAPDDPFAGEAPAIAISATPERRDADKVIRLAEHRPAASDRSLSPNERIAFREIGARLKQAGGEPPSADNDSAGTMDDEGLGTDTPSHGSEFESRLFGDDIPETVPDADDPLPFDDEGLIEDRFDEPGPEPDEIRDLPYDAEHEAEPRAVGAVGLEATDGGDEGSAEDAVRTVDTSILERLPVPVLIHSGDRLHFANQEFIDLTGYGSLQAFDLAGGLDALFVDEEESRDRDPDDHRRRMRNAAGEEFPVDAMLQSVPWRGGKALLLALKTTPAPAETGATAEELAELESRVTEMSTILDTATDGIVIIGKDGMIRSISRPAEALFGFDSGEVAGKPFFSLFAVESQRAARDYLNGLSDNGVASVLNDGREVIGREAQGRFIPLFMTIGKLPGAKGYCAVLRDITQWKRAEEELTQARAEAERASSQKTDFLARISHEIRTPLNAIIGFSELMIDEKFGPIVNDRYRDYLRDINRSGNHVLDLVNDLLDISKIEAGEQDMSYEAVSLNETLAEAVAMMQPQANRNRVIIRSSFASRLPEVVADLRSIRQIALNLLSNAVRYTQAGGQVIVSTSYEPTGDVVLRVRDTGVGMSQGEIEQALKPFKQINALKRPRGDGTGLGLPLTKAMVEANRARFSISSAPEEGTMVEIVFPSQRVLAG
jgi:PAS domain S-box-containing protein